MLTKNAASFRVLVYAALLLCGTVFYACGSGEGQARDAGVVDAPDARVPTRCDEPGGPVCESTERCFAGECVADSCQAEESPCEEGDLCDMQCVTVDDPCVGVECEAGTTCYQGSCVAGCFPPSPCLNVQCAEGEYCEGGSCFALSPCEGSCPEGYACNTICQPVSPCVDVECEETEVCVNGSCRDNPCYGLDCESGSICINGECVDTCEGCECSDEETCIFNECECVRECGEDSCGDPDGCGGTCSGCPTPGDICDENTGECSCDDSCQGKDCGEENGCGDPCVTNRGCGAGSCDTTDPDSPTCVCTAGGLEQCDDGDCCNASQDCIDTNGNGQTNRCCNPSNICGEGVNDQCCGGSQTCVTNYGCCNNNDTCPDTGGNCLCGSGRAINCNNTTVGDEFCCANNTRACEQADAEVSCCPGGFACFDSNDPGTEQDLCCTEAAFCDDSQVCCNIAAGEVCYDGDDNDAENDSCCAPSCEGKECGEPDGCGGLCVTDTCEPGLSCVQVSIEQVDCVPNDCQPNCNPCTEVCIAGSCEPKCSDGQSVDPQTCVCGGID